MHTVCYLDAEGSERGRTGEDKKEGGGREEESKDDRTEGWS